MAKPRTNYESLIGQVINDVLVVDTKPVLKVSKKSGKEYKVRRLWVTADGEHTLEIGTQSWKNWSFERRLDKITTEWIYSDEWFKEKEPVKVKEEPSYLDEFVKRKMQQLIDDLHDACM